MNVCFCTQRLKGLQVTQVRSSGKLCESIILSQCFLRSVLSHRCVCPAHSSELVQDKELKMDAGFLSFSCFVLRYCEILKRLQPLFFSSQTFSAVEYRILRFSLQIYKTVVTFFNYSTDDKQPLSSTYVFYLNHLCSQSNVVRQETRLGFFST